MLLIHKIPLTHQTQHPLQPQNKSLDNKMVYTPCGHYYCSECFFKWMKESRTCPICRKILAIDNQMEDLLEERRVLLTDINNNISSQFNLFRFLRRDNDRLDKTNRRLQRKKCELDYLLSSKKMELEDLIEERKRVRSSIRMLINNRRDWQDLNENIDSQTELPRTYTSIHEIERNIRQLLDEGEMEESGEQKHHTGERKEETEEELTSRWTR